jgi:hypothetical protein
MPDGDAQPAQLNGLPSSGNYDLHVSAEVYRVEPTGIEQVTSCLLLNLTVRPLSREDFLPRFMTDRWLSRMPL